MTRCTLVRLVDVLIPALVPHAIDPEKFYPIAGVYGFGRGMIKRPALLGQEIAADHLFRVKPGQFIYSRLKSFEGAFAIVSDDVADHFVSNEFPTFDLRRDRLEPAFLGWYFKQPRVWQQLASDGKGIGARRERLHPTRLLDHVLRLPPIDVQRDIVARLDAAARHILVSQRSANETRTELNAMLASAFSKLASEAPRAPMGGVAPLVRRAVGIEPEKTYTEIGVRSFYKGIFHRRTVSGSDFTWQKLFRIARGDLVFSNLMAWEQAIALASAADDGCVGNHRMLTCEADRTRCFPMFLWHYFRTPEGFAQVVAASPGSIARNKTLSAELVPSIKVPIPSLDAQQWFETLHTKAMAVEHGQAYVEGDLNGLMPALLNQAFG